MDQAPFPRAVIALSRAWRVTRWWSLPLPRIIGKHWAVFVTRADKREVFLTERQALDQASSMAAFVEPVGGDE